MRVLLQGDTHGNTNAIINALHEARDRQCERVIQLGDYGYGWRVWEGRDKFTNKVSRWATEIGVPLWWIDGNHENFDLLEAKGAFGAFESKELMPNVTYVPRGTVLELGGTRVLFVGGAYSVDKKWREPHRSWWPQEELTEEDVERCLAAGQVDVVLSHDVAHTGFRGALSLALDETDRNRVAELDHLVWKNDQSFPEAGPNRYRLERVLESARPRDWYHGHYHVAYEVRVGGTTFHGLAHEDHPGSRAVVEF